MEHTKTPWKVSATGGLIVPDIDNPIATICRGFGRDDDDFPNWKENARRIVACVNACEGIKTEMLEQFGNLEGLSEQLDRRDNEFKAMQALNIRLLVALKKTSEELLQASSLTDYEGSDYTEVYKPTIEAAHAAIAEAEKTPTP